MRTRSKSIRDQNQPDQNLPSLIRELITNRRWYRLKLTVIVKNRKKVYFDKKNV